MFDAGEDNADSGDGYYGMIDFAAYREKQTAFFENVVARAAEEFDAPGVEYRLLVSHMPVGDTREAYQQVHQAWKALANQMKLDLALHGHTHQAEYYPAGEYNGQNYPIIIGSRPGAQFIGTAVEFAGGKITAWFTGINHQITREINIG